MKYIDNKSICIFLVASLFIYGTLLIYKEPIQNDERIYAMAASWISLGQDANPEHPLLVKVLYSFVISEQDKEAIRSVNPAQYYYPYSSLALTDAIQRIRLFNAFAMMAVLVAVLLLFKDYFWFMLSFLTLYSTQFMFQAMLDGWLVTLAMVSVLLISRKVKYYQLAFLLIPFTKIYGIAVAVYELFLYRENVKWFGVFIMLLIFVFGIGYPGISFAFKHYSTTFAGGNLQTRYGVPFLSVLVFWAKGKWF